MHGIDVQNRFWNKVDKRSDEECWPWTGNRVSKPPYGRMSMAGRSRVATHISWEIANNASFPDGLNACHTCDNSICVNPKHIWPGTQSDNMQDCAAKGRLYHKPPSDVCKYGHDLTGEGARGTNKRCAECNRINARNGMRARRLRLATEAQS